MNCPIDALHYLHRVRKYIEKGKTGTTSGLFAELAEVYIMLHRIDSAEYYMKKALESPVLDNGTKLTLHRTRSLLDANNSDYSGALESYKKFHHLSDSLTKAGKSAEIARMRNWHELEQKDHENEILLQEHQKQQKLIRILTGALLMIIVLLALSVFLYRKTAEKNLELKNLNTVKDKLFSVVAHDLRSPMGALMSMLNLANGDTLDVKTQAQLLKDISARVDDTYGLLDNLLHWSKSQMQGMVTMPVCFDAQDGSRAVTDNLQSIAAHKNIVLNNCIEKQQIYADRDMFAVVVRNIAMNAIKYTPEVGEITLASKLIDNRLIISVRDNGTGMTQEVQDKLFKLSETRSQRGTNNESGTGLGLVLCADFVKINGGNIWFTSVQGEGSTFSFSVPAKS
jgi:signal transduction histidine kinase